MNYYTQNATALSERYNAMNSEDVRKGWDVIAVEPSAELRARAEQHASAQPDSLHNPSNNSSPPRGSITWLDDPPPRAEWSQLCQISCLK